MPRLQLRLLGGFEARIASGALLDIANKKTRALLAYLALPAGRAHSRDKLVGLLWSDRGDEQARNSLRQALAELGRVLAGIEPLPLVKARDSLALDPEAVEVDAMLFERLAAGKDAADLRHAAALPAGELLEGFGVRDPAFEDWLRDERQRYRDLMAVVLRKLLAHETGGPAIAVAQRLLALDPLREEGHRALMRHYADAGDLAAALRQYETCREMLKRDLDVVPALETETLHREIKQRPGAGVATMAMLPANASVPTAQRDASLSSRPVIAVLPFDNKSGDPDQQYFSDGVTEDIITELSRFHLLTVIAGHSSFAFRDQSLGIPEIGRRLGAAYIVDGSIWKAGDRLRIAVRLLDADSGRQLWAERYDRELRDIFAIRDEVVQAIVATLPDRIIEAGAQSARRKRPDNLEAYDHLLRGIAQLLTLDRAEEPQARASLERVIALDPHCATAYALLAFSHLRSVPRDRTGGALGEALKLARRAVALDDNDVLGHLALGEASLYHRQMDEAASQFQRAVILNPNEAGGAIYMGVFAAYEGRHDEAFHWMEKAFRLNPYSPPWYSMWNGMVLYVARRYADAIVALNRVFKPDLWELMYLAASYAQLGRTSEAAATLAAFQSLDSGRSVLEFARSEPFRNSEELDHLIAGLRKAEFPD